MLLGRFSSQIYALLRIVTGAVFALHGSQKLLGWPPMPHMAGAPKGPLPTLMIVAGVLELVCGLMVLIGFFADIAAFVASGEMAIAYFMGHVMTSHTIWPVTNMGDPAVLFCFVFLFIAASGAGIWSVDAAMRRGRVSV